MLLPLPTESEDMRKKPSNYLINPFHDIPCLHEILFGLQSIGLPFAPGRRYLASGHCFPRRMVFTREAKGQPARDLRAVLRRYLARDTLVLAELMRNPHGDRVSGDCFSAAAAIYDYRDEGTGEKGPLYVLG